MTIIIISLFKKKIVMIVILWKKRVMKFEGVYAYPSPPSPLTPPPVND